MFQHHNCRRTQCSFTNCRRTQCSNTITAARHNVPTLIAARHNVPTQTTLEHNVLRHRSVPQCFLSFSFRMRLKYANMSSDKFGLVPIECHTLPRFKSSRKSSSTSVIFFFSRNSHFLPLIPTDVRDCTVRKRIPPNGEIYLVADEYLLRCI